MPQGSNSVGVVKNILRYAVKSMGGEALDESLVTDGGLLGDRSYAVIDRSNDKVASAKMPRKWGELLSLSAQFVTPPTVAEPLPPVEIKWPDGSAVVSDTGDPDTRLSEMVGRSVTLTTSKPDVVSLERLDPLEAEETILDIGDIMMEGRFSDYAALHILTTASLQRLSDLRSDVQFEIGRFRPNLVIDTGGTETGFIENDWVGRTITIGDEVRLKITDPTPRCAIPTMAQHGGIGQDTQVLRTIVKHNMLPVPLLGDEVLPCVGVYAFVIQGGSIKQGDQVRVEA